ncbi:MAG: hypothetical protein ABI615_03060 [Chthoniobacterales bacterium]
METKARFSIRPPVLFQFAWLPRRNVQLILPACFIFAALIHVGVLFLFDVVYPQGKSARPRPAEISVLSPGTPEYEKIAAWLTANDPALLSATHVSEADIEQLLKTPYRPTFDSTTIHLQPSPPLYTAPAAAEVILPQDIVSNVVVDSEENASVGQPTLTTQVEFRGGLARQATNLPPAPPSAQSAEPAEFSIGLLPGGQIGFIFLKKGSGSADLDQKATEYLQNLELPKNDSGKIRWGVVVFHWGMTPPETKQP